MKRERQKIEEKTDRILSISIRAVKSLLRINFINLKYKLQEPGTELEIQEFVKKQYNVNFDLFSKIEVNGEKAHPLYKYLKYKTTNKEDSNIKWNFSKYLITRNGIPVKHYGPTVEPISIENDIIDLLNIKSKI